MKKYVTLHLRISNLRRINAFINVEKAMLQSYYIVMDPSDIDWLMQTRAGPAQLPWYLLIGDDGWVRIYRLSSQWTNQCRCVQKRVHKYRFGSLENC